MTSSPGHPLIKPCLLTHLGRGVMGKTHHHQAQLIPNAVSKLVVARSPMVFSPQRKSFNPRIGQQQPTAVRGIARIQDQAALTGIEHRKRQMGRPLLGPHQEQHFFIRVNPDAKPLITPISHRLPKRTGTGMQAIGRAARTIQTQPHGLQGHGWGIEIRRPKGKIHKGADLCSSTAAIELLAAIVAIKNAAAESLQSPRGLHPRKPAAAAWRSHPLDGPLPHRCGTGSGWGFLALDRRRG